MNTPTHDNGHDGGAVPGTDLPDSLRWGLRALRRDEPPSRELWPDIAARLQPTAREPVPSTWRWMPPVALAATLVIALGVTGVWRDGLPSTAPAVTDATPATLVQQEATGLARQYDAALSEVANVQTTASPALQPTIDDLDQSLDVIHDALARDPDSRLLLEQLRRTYAHRLALAQRAAYI